MTQAPLAPFAGIGDPVGPIAQPLPIGSLVYLASYIIRMKLHAETTGPDTPNMYSADLRIQGDQGDMNLDPLVGPRGYAGQHHFPLREQETNAAGELVNTQADLDTTLTNTPHDIGKYWLLDELDTYGNIVGEFAWIWWGTTWRKHMMGVYGVPGKVPDITVEVALVQPQAPPTYPDTTSWIDASGTTLEPTWVFNLAVPAGAPGKVDYLFNFPDFDSAAPLAVNDLMGCSGTSTESGLPIWKPVNISQYLPGPWSMPEASFSSYSGVSQQAGIGSYVIPPQPWPYTPVVWGHLGAGGATLSANPLMIGAEVLLGDPTNGLLISRGLGNTLGEVNVMPHYSRSDIPNHTADAITPSNQRAMVPANATAAQSTVYINLWNDGAMGVYTFDPKNAQLFIMVVPLLAKPAPAAARQRRRRLARV